MRVWLLNVCPLMGRKGEDSGGGGRRGGRKERRDGGREEGKMEGRKGHIFPESLLWVRPCTGWDSQVGKAERPGSRAEQGRGAGEGSRRRRGRAP